MANTQKPPGYKASKEQLLKRLARVEGQVGGVTRMVEEERYCIDVLTQIEAAQAALDKIALGLVDGHVRNCMRAGEVASEEQVQELMGAVGRLVSS
jgi:CsoR family transcriptional regulator, copper-sensing transcriptional repressor